MSVQAYFQIINDQNTTEEQGFHVFDFEWTLDPYVAMELYCTNPTCTCNEIHLEISRIMPNGKLEHIGNILTELPNFRIVEIKAKHKAVYQNKLKSKFETGIPDEWKPFLLDHQSRVKQIVNPNMKIQIELPKVSNQPQRNEPCPCGSGKKFKKCCGTVA